MSVTEFRAKDPAGGIKYILAQTYQLKKKCVCVLV